jgi:hypothetical protein
MVLNRLGFAADLSALGLVQAASLHAYMPGSPAIDGE